MSRKRNCKIDVFHVSTLFVFFLFVLSSVSGEGTSNSDGKQDKQKLQKESVVSIPPDYVRTHPPIDKANKPLNISVALKLWAIREVSAGKMEMEVDMYVYFTWVDYRIAVNHMLIKEIGGERIPLGENGPDLWHPFVQFRNCKGCKPLDLDPKTFIIHYDSNIQKLWTVIRVVDRFSCNINLEGYPMDKQICKIQLENYYEDTSQVTLFHDDKGPYTLMSDMTLSDFKIDKIEAGDCRAIYGTKSFSCMELIVHLSRYMGYHLTTIYAPTTFIVLLSWISFWLPTDVAPARITLGVTTLLTLATRLDQAQSNLPPVSYAKAIDVWMFACIFQVFASLIEFALSFSWLHVGARVVSMEHRKAYSAIQVKPFIIKGKYSTSEKSATEPTSNSKSPPRTTIIDAVSRVLFPTSFLVFNIIYWGYYLTR